MEETEFEPGILILETLFFNYFAPASEQINTLYGKLEIVWYY